MQRIPPSPQMQEALTSDLQAGIQGHPLRQFVARAAQLLLQVGLEEQVNAFFGRGHYERGPAAQPGYRNGYGERTVKTEAGPLTLRPPKVRQTATPFPLPLPADLRGVTPELTALARRAYVRGLSARDLEGLYAEVFGGSFSKSAVSRATAKLQADFDAWRT
ncbi:MAG: transposase, partial [Candidatus Methylomirabilales bacterium]